MIEQGENIKFIQDDIWYLSPIVTSAVYSHLLKPVNQEAAIRLDKKVFEVNGDQGRKKEN